MSDKEEILEAIKQLRIETNLNFKSVNKRLDGIENLLRKVDSALIPPKWGGIIIDNCNKALTLCGVVKSSCECEKQDTLIAKELKYTKKYKLMRWEL